VQRQPRWNQLKQPAESLPRVTTTSCAVEWKQPQNRNAQRAHEVSTHALQGRGLKTCDKSASTQTRREGKNVRLLDCSAADAARRELMPAAVEGMQQASSPQALQPCPVSMRREDKSACRKHRRVIQLVGRYEAPPSAVSRDVAWPEWAEGHCKDGDSA